MQVEQDIHLIMDLLFTFWLLHHTSAFQTPLLQLWYDPSSRIHAPKESMILCPRCKRMQIGSRKCFKLCQQRISSMQVCWQHASNTKGQAKKLSLEAERLSFDSTSVWKRSWSLPIQAFVLGSPWCICVPTVFGNINQSSLVCSYSLTRACKTKTHTQSGRVECFNRICYHAHANLQSIKNLVKDQAGRWMRTPCSVWLRS